MKQLLWIIAVALLMSLGVNAWMCSRPEPQPSVVVEHDTIYKDTTIYKPMPVDSHLTGEVVYIRIPYLVPVAGDTVTTNDSIEVPIPIEQKRYDDSLYTAWVSGYRPALDSITIHQREVVTTVTQTIVDTSPRLSVGIQAGAGVGLYHHRPDIYIGLGIQYRLWPNNSKKTKKK